ncbi:unnamed protein product, partial [Brassica oleracea]
QLLLYELKVDWCKETVLTLHHQPPLPNFGGHGRDSQPGGHAWSWSG